MSEKEQPPRRERGQLLERGVWFVLAMAATAGLVRHRGEIGEAHVALVYLLIVLGSSARGGRALGLLLALVCFFAFNFFFIPPYYTLAIHRPLDWLVLLTFLVTSAVATQLLHRAQAQAEAASLRAREVDRLALLGAETLNAGRAEDAVAAVARVIQQGLPIDACEIYMRDADGLMRLMARAGGPRDGAGFDDSSGAEAGTAGPRVPPDDSVAFTPRQPDRPDGYGLLSSDAKAVFIPLQVRDHEVGLLRLISRTPVALDPSQQRFADALSYYAALGLERVLLSATAAHAEAFREADHLKDVLLASVSHDLRTPLTTIKSLARELANGGAEQAVRIEEAADRLNGYVSDLLDLSRLNAESVPLNRELAAVDDLLGAALQQFAGTPDERRIMASLDPGEPLIVARFHFAHTLRALVNLLQNALTYSPPGSPVEVAVRLEEGHVVIDVADRGDGLAELELEDVFRPFFRGRAGAAAPGTGLGLPIARRAAELQGGALDYNLREGGGSVFSLRLIAVDPGELQEMS